MTEPKLSLRDLRIAFGPRTVVDLEHLELGSGEILGLAGESGSGKSITALAVLGLASTLGARDRRLPRPALPDEREPVGSRRQPERDAADRAHRAELDNEVLDLEQRCRVLLDHGRGAHAGAIPAPILGTAATRSFV